MKYLLFILLLVSMGANGQSRYPGDKYANGLSSQGNLWFYVEHVDRAVDSLTAQITHLQHQVDSLIQALTPKPVEGHSIDDAGTYFYPFNTPPPYSWHQTGKSKSLSSGIFGPDISGDTIGSVPSITAYIIDTRANTIAIDHRTKLPRVRPDHPVEGVLVKIKGRYQYFDGRVWVMLKELK